jgi:hypothetical protein
MLESNGLRIAAVSYDRPEILQAFTEARGIGFPLLSDRDSAAIRSFGIFNTNIAPGLRAHGVPHPVEYLVAPDGMVVRKYFVPNYQHRVAASTVALREFGAGGSGAAVVTLQSGTPTVEIGFSSASAFAGQEIGFFANFHLEPGWHITAASITFDHPGIVRQSFEPPQVFTGLGSLLLKFPFEAGRVVLPGKLRFQQCRDTVCEAPETIPFELHLTIEPFVVPTPKR